MEACVREQVRGFQGRGYAVRVFHRENSVSSFYRRNEHRMSHHITDTLAGYFIGRAARKAMHPDVVCVFSHSTVGWYPLRVPPGCKQFHLYHGTYRGQAEAIRPFISYSGYLKLKWWDSMMLERLSGRGKNIYTVADLIGLEVNKYFGYEGVTLGNPLDMSDFRPFDQRASRKNLGLPADGVVGVFVGTTQPNKNFPVIRRLVEALPEINWVLVIRGLPENFNGLSANARVLTNVPRNRLPELYSAADFSVCPSRYDAFPYVVPEAISCGIPVLSTLNGCSHQFLYMPPLNHLVIQDPDNITAFIAAAKDIASRPAYYRELVRTESQPIVEHWMNLGNFWKRFWEVTGL